MEATTTEAETYRWTQLSEDSFRVLEILCLEPILSIRLAEYHFQSPPEYHAISYAWGDEKPTEAILCDGCVLHITPNLREALRCIFSASKCHILWVDAICIDQCDDLEKALQVASMHRIFQSARGVFVWLGQADSESDIAMVAIDEVKDKLPKAPDNFLDTVLHMKSHSYHKIFDLSKFKPLLSLSQRAWFRRLWIVQEFIVGHSISVICGLKILESSSFIEVIGRLNTLSFGAQQPEPNEVGESPFEGFRMLWRINSIKESVTQEKATGFFDLVMFGRDRETFEPVDHIYAVLGLAEGSDEIYRKQIDVDYSEKNRKLYWNTYASFGKVALLHESHLKLLAYTTSAERPPDLPSWCPNLDSTPLTAAFSEVYAAGWLAEDHSSDHESQKNLALSCATAHPSFKGKNENHVELSSSSNSITIPGVTLDQISTVGYSCAWGPDFNTDNLYTAQPFAKELLKWIEDCQKICLDVLNDKDVADWTLEEVLVGANDRKRDEKGPPEPGSTKLSSLKFLMGVLLQILSLKPESAGRDQNPKLYEYFEPLLAWIVTLQEEWYNRVLFATKNGRLGMASKDIEVGDSVCLLYSGRTMYTLRPSGPGIHRFVSDAYVFRFMNGETFNLMHSGEVKEEHFVIE